MSVYFFWGQEEYNIEHEIEKIKGKFLDENFSSMNLRCYDAPDFKELQEILRTTGTMFGNIVNIVSCNRYIFKENNKEILSAAQIDELAKNLDIQSDNIHTIFTLKIPHDIEYKDLIEIPSKKLVKVLSANTNSKEFKFCADFSKELQNFVVNKAKEKGMTISSDVVKFIIKKVGVSFSLINSELDKIKLYIYPETKITNEHIQQFAAHTDDLKKISEYMIEGKKALALLEFKKCCQDGQHPLAILANLQKNFSKYIGVKSDIQSMSLAQTAQSNGIKEYPAKLMLEKMAGFSLSQIVEMKKNLIKAEEAIKINYSLFPELEVEKAILSDV